MIEITYETHYICHPYAGNKSDNIKKVLDIVKKITDRNEKVLAKAKQDEKKKEGAGEIDIFIQIKLIVPVAVHLLFPEFMSEDTFGREIAMEFCLELLDGCDRIRACGPNVTDGMRQEISYAGDCGIPIIWRNFD